MINSFSEKKQSIFFSFTSAPFSELPHFKPAHGGYLRAPGWSRRPLETCRIQTRALSSASPDNFLPLLSHPFSLGDTSSVRPNSFHPRSGPVPVRLFAVWRAGKPLWEWADSNIFKMWAFIRSSRWRKQSGAPRTKGREYFTQVWSTHQLDSAGTSSWNQWKKDHLCAAFGRSQHSLT